MYPAEPSPGKALPISPERSDAMQYTAHYASPLGDILLAADGRGLTGLWFQGQQHFARGLEPGASEGELPLFSDVRRWLDLYFSGQAPDAAIPLHLRGTAFQLRVWQALLTIPYGSTATYGQIARQLGAGPRSARAVGSAVGRNPVSILVPCHRVLGSGGKLTGYAAGLDRKMALLALEGILPLGEAMHTIQKQQEETPCFP